MPSIPHLFARLPRAATLSLFVMLACAAWTPASAQIIKTWAPQGDSLTPMASSARIRFQRQQGDSLAGDNYEAFEIVGGLGRKLFAALGKAHLSQAHAVQATLDSLGLDVEVATDPATPHIVFMLVRNPFRRSSDAVGFLYWLRGDQMHMQGASFPPGHGPVLRAWWTGRQDSPYEAAVLFNNAHADDNLALDLFRMDPKGYYWSLVQYAGHGPEFGRGARATFADANVDGQPEIVAYQPAETDSFFTLVSGVPPIVQELTFTERPEGFVLHDMRAVPGTTETLRLFTALLVQGDPTRARRLLLRPAALDTLLRIGWGKHHERGAFTVEYGEPFQPWPEWLEMRVRQDSGVARWIVHFWIEDGRWVIRDFIPVKQDPSKNRVVPLPDSLRSKRP
jgi:hypothetical protein